MNKLTHKIQKPITFQEFSKLVEQAHGNNTYAQRLWNMGFCDHNPTPKILDIPSPLWCFMATERHIAVLNHFTANHIFGKISQQIHKTLN